MSYIEPLCAAALPRLASRLPVPTYDRRPLRRSILHLGVGGFHRAHLADYIDRLCTDGHTGWSVTGAGLLPGDAAMAAALWPQDGLYTLITKGATGSDAKVVGSLVAYLHAHPDRSDLVDCVAHPDTQVVSLTITEGGYPVDDATGTFDPARAGGPGSAFAVLVEGLRQRRDAGRGPLTVVSCDNILGNGQTARTATLGTAGDDPDLQRWIEAHVAFPNSMVDRITPTTTAADRAWLAATCGVADRWPVVTEPFTQWVIQDVFAADRPPLEDVGAMLTADVEPYEQMKLRLLNAAHSSLAYLAALAGHDLVHEVMAEPRFADFVRRLLAEEAAPVLPPVPGVDLVAYQESLVERFANPGVGDQVARLCLDGAAKLPKFTLPTVRAQLARGGPVALAALAVAGWCRYLQGTADDGSAITPAADPLLSQARAHAQRAATDPQAFLGWRAVFGEDLAVDRRFGEAFAAALKSLTDTGVRSTLDTALSEEATPG